MVVVVVGGWVGGLVVCKPILVFSFGPNQAHGLGTKPNQFLNIGSCKENRLWSLLITHWMRIKTMISDYYFVLLSNG